MDGRPGINMWMKTSFRQFLAESKIQIPPTTHQQAMSIVAAAYFSHLARLYCVDGEEPGPEFEKALQDARVKYGDFELHNLDRNNPALRGKVAFRTSELPERYRKNIRTRDFVLKLYAGPRAVGNSNDGEYFQKSKGDPSAINVNVASVKPDRAVYNPNLIPHQLHSLESIVDHELQHMVQDVALGKLHPSQTGTNSARLAGQEDSDLYYNSQEEFGPQITTAASDFINSIRGMKDREKIQSAFYDAVDPRRNAGAYPFFAAVFKKNPEKWKKAVKEFHRLVQSQI